LWRKSALPCTVSAPEAAGEDGFLVQLCAKSRNAETAPDVHARLLMTRHIRIREEGSGLDVRVLLLDDLAPRWAEVLARLAASHGTHDGIHAMWTGPEISCPILAGALPQAVRELLPLPLENATSFPEEGELALVHAPANTWKGQPPQAFLDVGLFYGKGARLLMPMGWIQAAVCARVASEDLGSLRAACQKIRQRGACRLSFHPEP
jgi:hypothetical protein